MSDIIQTNLQKQISRNRGISRGLSFHGGIAGNSPRGVSGNLLWENCQNFSALKSQKIISYSSIVYGVLTRISQQQLWILNCLRPS